MAAVIAILAARGASPARAQEGDAWRAFRGRVVASDVFLVTRGFASDDALIDSLRRLERSVIGRGHGDYWRIHFAAFLSRPPEGSTVTVSFYDLADHHQPHRVLASEIDVTPGQTTVVINDFVVAGSTGFEVGHRYSVVAARAGAPRDELARGAFTLR